MQKGWPIGSERPESFQVAKQAEQSAEGPAPQGGRVRGSDPDPGLAERTAPNRLRTGTPIPRLAVGTQSCTGRRAATSGAEW